MRKYRFSERGSVSIYLIIILTAIFFLNAVLIDFARILAANNQADKATKAALRSVFSAYDTQLYESYGLFGLTNDSEEEIFLEAINKNLYVPHEGFTFIDLKLDEASVNLAKDHYLVDHTVYEQQILEEMKYIAPITLTEELIDSFTSFTPMMEEATKTTKALNDVSKLYEERQELLNEAVKYQQESTDLYNEMNNFESISAYINDYGSYVDNLNEYKKIKNGEDYPEKESDLSRLNNKITSYQADAKASKSLYNRFNSSEHQDNLTKAKADVKRAKGLNDEIIQTINEANAQSSNDSQFDELNELKNSLNDLVIDEQFFIDFEKELENQHTKFNNVLLELDSLSGITSKALKINVSSSNSSSIANQYKAEMSSSLSRIKEQDKIYQNSSFDESNQKRVKALDELESQLDEKEIENTERESKKDLDSLNKDLKSFEELSDQQDEVKAIDLYYKDYREYNLISTNPSLDLTAEGDPEDVAVDAMSKFSELLTSLPELLEKARNELYINEYILTSFNSFDLTMLNLEDTEKLIEALDINNQEVEYIIYGSNILGGNITKALTEIFLIRIAIRTAEGLFKFKGHPLAVLVEAIAYGIKMASQDMYMLIDGKSVEFSSFIKGFTIDYDGYLRLLLVLHRDKTDKLARSQAVIAFNTGKDLANVPTYLEANTTTSIKLWFLPGVMKSLDMVGALDGKVEGNRYKIDKKAVFAY